MCGADGVRMIIRGLADSGSSNHTGPHSRPEGQKRRMKMKVETTVTNIDHEKGNRRGKSALPGIFPANFVLTKSNASAVAASFGKKWQSKFLSTLLLSSPEGLTKEQITGALLDTGYRPNGGLKAGQTLIGAALARLVQHINGVRSGQVKAFKSCVIVEKEGRVIMTTTRKLPVLDVSHIDEAKSARIKNTTKIVRAKNSTAKNIPTKNA